MDSVGIDGRSFQHRQADPNGKARSHGFREAELSTAHVLQVFVIGDDSDAEEGPASENEIAGSDFSTRKKHRLGLPDPPLGVSARRSCHSE